MCVYVYVYMHTCMHAFIHIYIYTRLSKSHGDEAMKQGSLLRPRSTGLTGRDKSWLAARVTGYFAKTTHVL